LTRLKATTRPPTIYVERWRGMTAKQKQNVINNWKVEGSRNERENELSGKLKVVLTKDHDRYDELLTHVRKSFMLAAALAMFCFMPGHDEVVNTKPIGAVKTESDTSSHAFVIDTIPTCDESRTHFQILFLIKIILTPFGYATLHYFAFIHVSQHSQRQGCC
jgi:hypothetical protein